MLQLIVRLCQDGRAPAMEPLSLGYTTVWALCALLFIGVHQHPVHLWYLRHWTDESPAQSIRGVTVICYIAINYPVKLPSQYIVTHINFFFPFPMIFAIAELMRNDPYLCLPTLASHFQAYNIIHDCRNLPTIDHDLVDVSGTTRRGRETITWSNLFYNLL